MRVWRISNHADLGGRGGLLADGRWHHAGRPVLYCADHPSTALLEVLVHLDFDDVPAQLRLMAIDVPDDASLREIAPDDLPAGWRDDTALTREIGTRFLETGEHLALRVPSAVLPAARNILLNPRHREADAMRIAEVIAAPFDRRLIR